MSPLRSESELIEQVSARFTGSVAFPAWKADAWKTSNTAGHSALNVGKTAAR